MAVQPWLEGLRARLTGRRSRRSSKPTRRRATHRQVQTLENRTLLAATILVNGTELRILSDADEDIVVQQDPANLLNVEVTIDGVPSPAVGVLAASSLTQLTIISGDEANTIDIQNVDENIFTGLTGPTAVSISMGNGNDTFLGSPNVEATIDAGDGDDVVTSFGAADTILGGDGDDNILGGGGDDSINAGDGTDVVDGEIGDDTIIGGDGPDVITGGPGLDSILGGDGNDVLSGDAGVDFVQGDLGDDILNGGIEDDVMFGGGGADQLNGDEGNDQIFGNSGDDIIMGGVGDDLINAGNGDDSVLGGDGNEFVQGGAGNDTIHGEGGDDIIRAGSGDDLVYGDGLDPGTLTFGNDVILGESGNDTLIGTAGADTITGGTGDDLIQSSVVEEVVAPPPPPVPVAPPPPMPGQGAGLPDAFDSGQGSDVGNIYQLTTGAGDGNVNITGVSATGNFFSAVFDPLGPIAPAETNFGTDVYFRPTISGTGARTDIDSAAQNVSNIRGNNNAEANSTFTIGNLTFALTQQIVQTFDPSNVQDGSLLIQSYRITNTGAAPEDFELVRYWDADLSFDGSLLDGGGRVISSTNDEILFEVERGQTGSSATTFVGITGRGGTEPAPGRFEINRFPGLLFDLPNGINPQDFILNDGDGDGFIDPGSEFDVTLALANRFTVAPSETALYTTHTLFGNGVPNNIGPVNMPPVAVDDTTGNQTFGTNPLTIDIVSNDTDSDGAIDFSTIVVSQPANGTVVNLGNGLVTYTANFGFSGTDTFSYTIQDNSGATSNPATVSVTVAAGDVDGDLLNGGLGNDTMIGAGGDDTIIGDQGADSLQGGDGNDSMLGAGGNDTVDGQDGNDTIYGNGGQDVVLGGANEDTLVWRSGLDGTDMFSGGSGGDRVEVRGDALADIFMVGQTAEGRLTVTEGAARLTLDFDINEIQINSSAGNDVITLTDVSNVVLSRLTINGGSDDDAINSSNGGQSSLRLEINGDLGRDTLTGGDSAETLSGGDGDDVIMSGAGNDVVNGDDGADTINGEDGNDTVDGGIGNDSILGGNGNDSISGGDDNDTVDGEAGNDTIDGGSGDDNLVGSFGDDSVSGGLGLDALIGGSGNDVLDGGRNNDVINGNSGNDTILGDDGDDYIRGNSGSDEIVAGDGDDTVFAGDGADGIDGGDGDDQLFGDNGSDVVVGGDGADSIHGGGAQDTILGQEGNDTLLGAGGTDVIAGGQGTNTFDPLETAEINELFVLTSELLDRLDGM